ncbi:MAG TPA: hypothetical protein VGU61_09030 [Noviherbaspirillum sp.]|jgi:hypothetical protein|uniref:hypothetical protein n=1 Tax=Noviherbaspirillum sp. TaxID=1926288 RepID=UPI002DDD9BF9|nr:hypothetical protein [Noviherbaspirillum sp.]HEV2610396.1 hypothetical protein [Noviherbaspirillum sp.]
MEPTNSMVRAAVRKAVESGLLARNAAQNEYDWEVMRGILRAAFEAGKVDLKRTEAVPGEAISSFAQSTATGTFLFLGGGWDEAARAGV